MTSDAPSVDDGGRRRTAAAVAGVIALVVGGIIALVVLQRDGDESESTSTSVPAPATTATATTVPTTTAATTTSADTAPTTTAAPGPDRPPLVGVDPDELGPGTAIDGLDGARSFVVTTQDGAVCSLLLTRDGDAWREICDAEPGAALTMLDGSAHEIVVDAAGRIVSGRQLAAAPPSNGCLLADLDALLAQLPGSSVVNGLGCVDASATLTTGGVILQPDRMPDGAVWIASSTSGAWVITDTGTGLDGRHAFGIVGEATWSSWTPTIRARPGSGWDEVLAGVGPAADPEQLADEILSALATADTDPEFPLNERIVAVEPDGRSLIVAEVDVGGDDSVRGQVLHVWIAAERSDGQVTGWRIVGVLAGSECARAATPDGEFCV